MKWFRIQEKDSELRYIDNDKLLVTDKPKVIWETWFGFETCDVYEVTGKVIESRTETHEDEEGNIIEIKAPIIKVEVVKKVDTWKFVIGDEIKR